MVLPKYWLMRHDMGLNPQRQRDKPSSLKSYNTRKMTPKVLKNCDLTMINHVKIYFVEDLVHGRII
jgi:hypothetical protein